MKTDFRVPALILLSALSLTAQAQELRLFEPIEVEPGEQPVMAEPQMFAAPTNGQPAYTLRSVSRFGDEYRAVLLDRSGQVVQVTWRAGETAPLPVGGFAVVEASAGTVALQHPAGDPCVAAELSGVACLDGNRSQLRLTSAAPLASNGAPPAGVDQGFFGEPPMGPVAPPVDPAFNVNGQQVFINPFSGEPEVMPQLSEEEVARRQERQEARAERLRAFGQRQQIINEQDVPPGMRLVRTPFGDTLVPE